MNGFKIRNRNNYTNVYTKMNEVGMKLLWSEEEFKKIYKNNKTKLDYLGKCGHKHTSSLASITLKIKRGNFDCPDCSYGHKQRIKECYNEKTNQQKCYKCGEWKNRDECYSLEKKGPRRECKDCRNEYMKKHRLNWTEEEFIAAMVKKAKHRHKTEKYEGVFNITEEDILELKEKQNNKCVGTGNELIWKIYQDPFYMVSLDRIDSSITYTKDNIQLVCWFYNNTKGNHSDDDFIKLCKQVSSFS